jgi:hypothetical protein
VASGPGLLARAGATNALFWLIIWSETALLQARLDTLLSFLHHLHEEAEFARIGWNEMGEHR